MNIHVMIVTACSDGTKTLVGLIDVTELSGLLPGGVPAVAVVPRQPGRLREGEKKRKSMEFSS